MKRFTFTLLLFCILCTAQAKDRVIERPTFLAWSSTSIEVDQIVISDTATVVHIKAFYRPKNWIKIAKGSYLKDDNNQIYPIRKGIGITLDKEFWLPESGEGEFQLIFPPLPENVSVVDFSEGDFEGAFKIWGIQLDKKPSSTFTLPKGVTLPKINSKLVLPEPIQQYGKAILKGKILGFREGMPKEALLLLNDAIRGRMVETEISIKEDGTFYQEIDAFTVTPAVLLLFRQEPTDCMLAPGETTSVTINLREIARQRSRLLSSGKPLGKKVYYSGYLAGLQQELSDNKFTFSLFNNDYEEMMKNINDKTPEEYKAFMLKEFPEYRKQIAHSKCSPAWKEIQNIKLDISIAEIILETEMNLQRAHIMTNKLEQDAIMKYYKENQIIIPKGYYQSLNELSSLYSPKADYSVNLPYLISLLSRTKDTDKIMEEDMGIDKGYLADCVQAMKIGSTIRDFKPLNDEQRAQLSQLPAAYSKMIEGMNDSLLKKIEANKKKTGFTINEAGEVTNEDLFASIISKFRGHALLVDFWATWCGPCRMANKAMIPMKEELKDRDIIYLYITGETSPMETWQNMIPDIHGEHFRLTNAQWTYLSSYFNIRGVPSYFVIDPEGNITHKETGFSGVENIKEQLLKALNK